MHMLAGAVLLMRLAYQFSWGMVGDPGLFAWGARNFAAACCTLEITWDSMLVLDFDREQ